MSKKYGCFPRLNVLIAGLVLIIGVGGTAAAEQGFPFSVRMDRAALS